jgi:pimeloyl-ACP methyl ester carboxylesterase
MSASLGFGAGVLSKLDVRLLCIDRAGIGRSDPDPDKSHASFVADVRAVLDALQLGPVPTVGFSQGASFAVALAGAGAATTLALVSGQDEFTHPTTRALLVPDVASLVTSIEADRSGFESSFATRVDAEGLWSLVLAMSAPSDRAFFAAAGFAEAYRQSLHEGFAQGPQGYVRDLTLSMGAWPTAPEAIRSKVALWYGLLDASPVHSPDFGTTLSRRFPDAVLHHVPDAGSAVLWTHASEILNELLAAHARESRP